MVITYYLLQNEFINSDELWVIRKKTLLTQKLIKQLTSGDLNSEGKRTLKWEILRQQFHLRILGGRVWGRAAIPDYKNSRPLQISSIDFKGLCFWDIHNPVMSLVTWKWGIWHLKHSTQALARSLSWCRGAPHAAQNGWECCPTQNCKFTYNIEIFLVLLVFMYLMCGPETPKGGTPLIRAVSG